MTRARYPSAAQVFVTEINAKTICAHCGAQPIEWHNPEHVELNRRHMRISVMVNTGHSIAAIRDEMARCTPLCRRCHMEEDGRLNRFVIEKREPSPCIECSRLYKPLRRGLCARCATQKRRSSQRGPCCSNCGMRHKPSATSACIEGHGVDPVHGKDCPIALTSDPMSCTCDDEPVPFRGQIGTGF